MNEFYEGWDCFFSSSLFSKCLAYIKPLNIWWTEFAN